MASRHRFLERSITHVSFHNRLTEEEAMWRRRENEREPDRKRPNRSRSPYEPRRKRRTPSSSKDESRKPVTRKIDSNQAEPEFGPPLPSNLGINADRWDHAFFMQRYPQEYEKQINKPKRRESTSSEDKKEEKEEKSKGKKKHSNHSRRSRNEEKNQKKTKRRHRSRS